MSHHWNKDWQKWAVTIAELIMAVAVVWVVLVRTVDISRLPEVVQRLTVNVQRVNDDSNERDHEILLLLGTNGTKMDVMTSNQALFKSRQDVVIKFINGLTNHPPIEWPTRYPSKAATIVDRQNYDQFQ